MEEFPVEWIRRLCFCPRFMKNVILFLSAAITVVAAPADDYKALTSGIPALKMGGTAGGVALSGRMAFPLAISTKQEVPVGAGYFGDSEKGGRVVCFAHTSFLGDAALAKNVARWAGRKDSPRVLCAGASSREWKGAGLEAASAKGALTADVLKGGGRGNSTRCQISDSGWQRSRGRGLPGLSRCKNIWRARRPVRRKSPPGLRYRASIRRAISSRSRGLHPRNRKKNAAAHR